MAARGEERETRGRDSGEKGRFQALQDSGDLATDFSVAKSKKSVSKSFSDGFATEKNSVGKTLVAKLSDGNLQSVAKFSEGL